MTDNPSGSTGQNVTVPPNAPEAGSNESSVIADIVRKHGGHPTAVAAKLIEAGFTRRAQHAGETTLFDAVLIRQLRHERDAAICARDEARAERDALSNACGIHIEAADQAEDTITLLRAERDALAAKLAHMDQRYAELHETMNRVAEREDRAVLHAIKRDADVTAAEKRAAALASALRKEIERCPCCRGKGVWETNCPYCGDSTFDHECVTETKICDRCAPARAALAGNGNGNGTGGDGWIACSERMPDQQLPGHRRGRPALVYVQCDNDAKFIDLEWWDPTSKSWWNTDPKAGQHITHWRPLPAAPPSAGETNDAR